MGEAFPAASLQSAMCLGSPSVTPAPFFAARTGDVPSSWLVAAAVGCP